MYSVSHLLHTTELLCQPWNFLNNQITVPEKLLIGELWVYFTPLLIEKKKMCRYIEENLFSLNSDYLLEIHFHILFCKTSFILQ